MRVQRQMRKTDGRVRARMVEFKQHRPTRIAEHFSVPPEQRRASVERMYETRGVALWHAAHARSPRARMLVWPRVLTIR